MFSFLVREFQYYAAVVVYASSYFISDPHSIACYGKHNVVPPIKENSCFVSQQLIPVSPDTGLTDALRSLVLLQNSGPFPGRHADSKVLCALAH